MRMLVFGAGAIGCAFGAFLSRHHDVTLFGRKSSMMAIRSGGLRISGIWGRHSFSASRCETDFRNLLRQKGSFELVLLTVKSYDTHQAARMISKLVDSKTMVLSLQNGLGNIELLHHYVPKKQVLAGRVIFGVEFMTPKKRKASGVHIRITVSAEPTAVGETRQRGMTKRVKQLARIFSRSGIPTVASPDIRALLWKKVIYNCALNPLASLLRCHYGHLGESPMTKAAMAEIIHEIYEVAQKARVPLKPSTPQKYLKLFYGKLLPRTYDHHPSMLQDLKKRRETEIHALNGQIVKLGKKYGVATPINRCVTELIRERSMRA